jgi:lipopolysaccharide/colanic/teichoic acid biosynthesis glycosyltransferase
VTGNVLTAGENLSIAGGGAAGQHLVVVGLADAEAPSGAAGLALPVAGWRGKRALDLIVTAVLVLLFLPLLAVIALAVKLTSPGPALFRQRRVGRGDREFPILKFRTMFTDAEQQLRKDRALHEQFVNGSHKLPSRLDPRVTRVGRFLRRTSLDELPQLFNVLAGHMSLVGPRPVERTQFVRDYGGFEDSYLRLRPGLTGLWQVSGRSTIQFPERAQLDSCYLAGCGPWTDAKILARTPLVIVTGLGAD